MKSQLIRRICCTAAAVLTMAAALPLQTFAAEKTLPSGKKESELSSLIEGFWKDHESTAAGMATAVFNSKKELYSGYFGSANKEKNIPVTEDSVIEWGSVSKLTVWVSVMQLKEQGKIDLNADVTQYLPQNFFKHRKYDDPITMMNLMNHNAGFEETAIGMDTSTEANIVSLEEYITNIQPCQVWKPGETVAYSNWGATLAAYIVERVSGMPYYQYAQENIFKPLGMEHTAINADLSDNPAVKEKRRELQGYLPTGQLFPNSFTYIIMYPVGMCTSTLTDFETFAQALLAEDSRLMKKQTFEEMYTPSLMYTGTEDVRLCHGFMGTVYKANVIGHGGNTQSCSSYLLLDRDDDIGFVVMANQYGESKFNTEMPDLIFGETKEKKLNSDCLCMSARTFKHGMLKLLGSLQGITPMVQNPPAIVKDMLHYPSYMNETSDRVEISVMDLIKSNGAEAGAAVGILLLMLLGILICVICLLVKFIKLIIRKHSRNPLSWWRTRMSLLIPLPLILWFVYLQFFMKAQPVFWAKIVCIIEIVLGLLLVIGIIGGIRRMHKREEKICGFRNVLTMFFAIVAVAMIVYFEMYTFWLV